jgi:hypothetical protein
MGAVSQPAARGRNTPSRMRTEQELLVEISLKLDRLVAVLAAQGKPREIQIDILSAAGCDSLFIGTVVGLTAGRVRAIQSRRRKTGQETETSDASVEAAVT